LLVLIENENDQPEQDKNSEDYRTEQNRHVQG
jgi:hypothetical protein